MRAIEAARRAIRPGVIGKTVDEVARRIVADGGYDEFPHALGHQVGRYAHDGTALLGPEWEKYARRPFVPIEEGMVFTLEPRLTVPGYGVATVEEMVVVTGDGAAVPLERADGIAPCPRDRRAPAVNPRFLLFCFPLPSRP